MMKSST